jgi:hypothetical protein
MARPVFSTTAKLSGVGPVDVSLFQKEDQHIRMVVTAGPGDVVLDDTTDGSLLHAYESIGDVGHKFGPCLFSGARKLQSLDFSFATVSESENFSVALFARFCGAASLLKVRTIPRKCGILHKVLSLSTHTVVAPDAWIAGGWLCASLPEPMVPLPS